MPSVAVSIIIGTFSGAAGAVVTQGVSFLREKRDFQKNKKSEAYNFFVFTVSGVIFGSQGESYDFQRMVNEAVAKVALYASKDVVSAIRNLNEIEELESEEAYTAFLAVIGSMRRDVGSGNQEIIDNILQLRKLGRRALPPDLLSKLDDYIDAQDDPKPTRTEAVQALIRKAFAE